MRNIHPKIT